MKKISVLFLITALLTGCVDTLDDYNTDTKKASSVLPEQLFSMALKNLTDVLTTPNVNTNNIRYYVQHWTATTYTGEPQYDMTSRIIPENFWNALYRDVLADLQEARRLLEADALLDATLKNNQLAQIELIEVYAWSVLIRSFGDVPYSEALDFNNSLPVYDDDRAIYLDLMTRLDAAIGKITITTAGFGAADLIYTGKMENWRKFGYGLKLKLAMGLTESPEDAALVTNAVQNAARDNGAFLPSSAADNARFPYIADAPNNNPIATNLNTIFTSREDYLPANTLVDFMNATEDPRRPVWFRQNTIPNTDPAELYPFKGGKYGHANATTDASFSRFSARLIAPTRESLLMDFIEIEFFLAEAVERGYITGDAEAHYNKAIAGSMAYWGVSTANANTYLSRADVAYSTAPGTYIEKIGRQKWVALFDRGYDAWVEWRRLNVPALSPPVSEKEGDGIPPGLIVPLRLIYPVSEQTLNGANRGAAADKLVGGDVSSAPLFWVKDRN